MSEVTNVLLAYCSTLENKGDELIGLVNGYLREWDHRPLAPLDGHAGGEKVWSCTNLYGGAFRAFYVQQFIDFVFGLEWEAPDDVYIIIQGEGDYTPGMMHNLSLVTRKHSHTQYGERVRCGPRGR